MSKKKCRESEYSCHDPLREEAHRALNKEYEAACKRSRSEKVILERGVYQKAVGDRFLYRFSVSPLLLEQISADRPHKIEIQGTPVNGAIAACGDRYVEIELGEDRGRILPQVEVIFDLTILIDLPEEVAFSRKADMPHVDYLRERRPWYLQLRKRPEVEQFDGETTSFVSVAELLCDQALFVNGEHVPVAPGVEV